MMEGVVDTPMTAERESQYLRLIEAHDATVRRLVASVERDHGRRQDLGQDIWLALWQALPSFRGDCAERTFVLRIVHNRAVSHIQHWKRRATEPLEPDTPLPDRGASPERAAGDQQRQAHLQAAVAALPLGLKQAVVLMLEGLSHREIADVLGITENTVAVRLSRARATLTERLHPREVR